MRRVLALAATALCSGCPSPRVPRPPDDAALRLRVARAEARRAAGVADLTQLARGDDPHARALALRGLGRIGGPDALAVLEAAVADPRPEVATAAWLAADHSTPTTPAVAVARVTAFGTGADARVDEGIDRALGDRDPAIAAAAALALGRHAKRDVPLGDDDRAALAGIAASGDAGVRYAATWALAQGKAPLPNGSAAAGAVAARVADADPAVRAVAIAGLARHHAVGAAHDAIVHALGDADWRVAVEAVRALAGPAGDDAGRDAVATALVRRWDALAAGDGAQAQVITEGLRALAPYGARPIVAAALAALATDASAGDPHVPALARGWIGCLATAALVRAQPQPDLGALASCGGGALPDPLRLPLVGDLVTAGAGDAAFRRAALHLLLSSADVRVRAAGLTALPATWHDGDPADQRALVATLASAVGSPDPVVAGAAVEAATALYTAMADDPARAALDAAVVARAGAEHEPELASDLFALIGAQKIAAGEGACRAGLAGAAVAARAAAACLRALGEAVPVPPIGAAAPPPVDVAAVIGRDVRWHLVTTRGDIDIALRPDVAPWNVAAIVALTRRGFYDGLAVHRVVPGFVVQGGDPTMSGWGGPGFVTPAEPAGTADAAPFDAGAVGMADAGRDSAGSQWFIMHGRAPHLDARYTCVGRVVAGRNVADQLLIGDRVVRATALVR